MRNYSIHNMKWENRGHELDGLASLMLNETNEYYLTGSKEEIETFYERTGQYIKVTGIMVQSRQESYEFMGKAAVAEEDAQVNNHTILICTAKNRAEYEAWRKKWRKKGLIENQRFFQGELFSMIYDVYVRNLIRIDRIEVFLTSRCTLNCEKCISYIPYFTRKRDIPLEQLKKDADILFSKVDYIYKLKLLGGEGLLYPYLIEYIDYLCERYQDKIGIIRIGTNGTILPNQEILDMCVRNHVILDVSDYSQAVPDKSRLNEIKTLCDKNHVAIEIKRTGEQWLDLGFPDKTLDKRNEKQIQEHFYGCAMFCRQFGQGKMWFCCTNFAAVCAGLFTESENDYFDFATDFSKKELLEYEVGYSRLGHTTFCNVCGGCSDEVNPCQVEVARQMREK